MKTFTRLSCAASLFMLLAVASCDKDQEMVWFDTILQSLARCINEQVFVFS